MKNKSLDLEKNGRSLIHRQGGWKNLVCTIQLNGVERKQRSRASRKMLHNCKPKHSLLTA